ncbi:2'-5' RNA ligase family protein [Candidatus Micrarchaeota archaeon]|nr:2'-5' RNA ligase family protein [Candidatus Micrarchaeota archaeon]MBU1930628.1 2'-5' RNA ligase family protein [Candidatus Micrarchaeota archaeon]
MRFSIVSYFDQELTKEIQFLQEKLLDLSGSSACLDIWEPHITVGSGVEMEQSKLPEFYQDIQSAITSFEPFEVAIAGFDFIDSFVGKVDNCSLYVVYLRVIPSEKLQLLAERIKKHVTDKQKVWYTQPWPFIPHITLAFKDLSQEGFEKAKVFFQNEHFTKTTKIDHVSIVLEIQEKKWREYKRFGFQENP